MPAVGSYIENTEKSEGYSGALTPSAAENHILGIVLNSVEHVLLEDEVLRVAFFHVRRVITLKKQADLLTYFI